MKHAGSGCLAAATALFIAYGAMAANPPNPKDLTQGHWELQPAKSHFCEPGPQKSTREIADMGWGLVSIHWTGNDAKGGPIDVWYVYRYDGQKYPSDIVKRSDVAISWKLADPSHVEFVDWQNDKAIAENVRAVSGDGQVMTQTTKHLTGTAKGCTDSQVFARQ